MYIKIFEKDVEYCTELFINEEMDYNIELSIDNVIVVKN